MPSTERRLPLDRLLIVAFSIFAFTSLVLEQWIVWGVDLQTATDPVARAWRWYAESFDPLLLDRRLGIRITFGVDAFVFGIFYVVLVYAFVRRKNWIRIPALLYGGAMLYSVLVYSLKETLSEHAGETDLLMVFLFLAPYTIVPLLLIYRMWEPQPFGPTSRRGRS